MQYLTLGSKLFTLQKGDLDIMPSWEVPKIILRTTFDFDATQLATLYIEWKDPQ